MEKELAHALLAALQAQRGCPALRAGNGSLERLCEVCWPLLAAVLGLGLGLGLRLGLASGLGWNGPLVAQLQGPLAESLGDLVECGWWAWCLPPVESGPGFHDLERPQATAPTILLPPSLEFTNGL